MYQMIVWLQTVEMCLRLVVMSLKRKQRFNIFFSSQVQVHEDRCGGGVGLDLTWLLIFLIEYHEVKEGQGN